MKFITEMELRDLYRAEPFTTYVLAAHQKITPGARQFLADRKVRLVQAQDSGGTAVGMAPASAQTQTIQEPQRSWCALRLRSSMEYLESLFLLAGAEFLSCEDSVLGEEVMELGACFRKVRQAEQQQTALEAIIFWEWSEEQIKGCAANLGQDFEIRECHVRLKMGKAVALLNHLRASLRELEAAIGETYWDEARQACRREDLREKVNVIINILCIMMWKCLGGQKCQQ